jgi:PST family polysaccharide transporter
MRMPALKRFANPDVTRDVANLVWPGLERLTQIGVAIANSNVLARYFGRNLFDTWQYANTLLLVLSPITWVCGSEILVPTIVHRQKNSSAAPSRCGSACRRRRCCDVGGHSAGTAAGFTDPLVGARLAGLAVPAGG